MRSGSFILINENKFFHCCPLRDLQTFRASKDRKGAKPLLNLYTCFLLLSPLQPWGPRAPSNLDVQT